MARKKKIDKEMGLRLKQARTEQKLTYEELAEKSGVSSRYIKEIENHGNVPSIEKLRQLIQALHISADPFFYPDTIIPEFFCENKTTLSTYLPPCFYLFIILNIMATIQNISITDHCINFY